MHRQELRPCCLLIMHCCKHAPHCAAVQHFRTYVLHHETNCVSSCARQLSAAHLWVCAAAAVGLQLCFSHSEGAGGVALQQHAAPRSSSSSTQNLARADASLLACRAAALGNPMPCMCAAVPTHHTALVYYALPSPDRSMWQLRCCMLLGRISRNCAFPVLLRSLTATTARSVCPGSCQAGWLDLAVCGLLTVMCCVVSSMGVKKKYSRPVGLSGGPSLKDATPLHAASQQGAARQQLVHRGAAAHACCYI